MAQLLHDSPALLHAAGSTLFLTNHPNLTARNVPVSGFDLLCRQRWCRGRRRAAAVAAASGGGWRGPDQLSGNAVGHYTSRRFP